MKKAFLEQIKKVLKKGGVIAFPTETVYGIGASIYSIEGIKKIYKIKKRPKDKPLQILISKKSQIKDFADKLNAMAKKIIRDKMPGPVTIIVSRFQGAEVPRPQCPKIPRFRGKHRKEALALVSAGKNTVGLRIPDHPVIKKILDYVGPIAATSANISEEKEFQSMGEIKKKLKGIDLFIDEGSRPKGRASMIVDVTKGKAKILR